jgi:protein arginine kinase activator
MLCQKCRKNLATARYAEVVDGKVTDLHLCAECLSKQQEAAGPGFQLSGPVAAAKTGASGGHSERPRTRVRRVCKSCGTQLAKVLDTGKVGCGKCYEAFAEEIEPMVSALHGSTEHQGKTPRVDDARARLRTDLQTKRTLLRSALETENYEDAAGLRDDIRQLELVLGATLPAQE